jgi:hypothetical protein
MLCISKWRLYDTIHCLFASQRLGCPEAEKWGISNGFGLCPRTQEEAAYECSTFSAIANSYLDPVH